MKILIPAVLITDERLSGEAVRLYAYYKILIKKKEKGRHDATFASQLRVALDLGWSIRKVQRKRQELLATGWIEEIIRKDLETKGTILKELA